MMQGASPASADILTGNLRLSFVVNMNFSGQRLDYPFRKWQNYFILLLIVSFTVYVSIIIILWQLNIISNPWDFILPFIRPPHMRHIP